MGTVHGKTVTLHIQPVTPGPFPGTPEGEARIVVLLEQVYAGRGVLEKGYEDAEYIEGVGWIPIGPMYRRIVDTDQHTLMDLTEAECMWAAEWLTLKNQPRVELRERQELARLQAKYGNLEQTS